IPRPGAERPDPSVRNAPQMRQALLDRARQAFKRRVAGPSLVALLVASCLTVMTGCNSFRVGVPAEATENRPKEPIVVAPNNYAFRISQFAFLADFELKADQPLFRELRELPDQVYKELELPASNILIQIY